MLAFILSIFIAFAYNPYVHPLRKPHQATGATTATGPTMPMYGEMDLGDLFEDYYPFMRGAMSGAVTGATGGPTGSFNPFVTPYMNNPYRMNMQKCMDNDACTAWVTHQMYKGLTGGSSSSTASTGASASTDASAASTDASSTGTDASSGASTGGASSGTGFTPAMLGFPAGFNPAFYGLDWDARPVDCMDDSKCARGLMMFTSGRSMGGAIGGAFAQMFMPSRLQRPRRLSRPHYGVPYRYGRQF